VLPAAELPAQHQTDIPTTGALVFEAEANWSESGGTIRLSGGGHENTSGGDNLWAWNKPGHAITWALDVPAAGDYEMWIVGATETGLLAEATIDNAEAMGLWFAPPGGWGRKNADQWRGYRLQGAGGRTTAFGFNEGIHPFTLTNRSGMGLNVDRIILVRKQNGRR